MQKTKSALSLIRSGPPSLLSDAKRKVLNSALEKYRPGQSEPILVGGENLLKTGVAADEPVFGTMSLI